MTIFRRTHVRPSTAAAAQANLVVSYPAPGQISPNRAASRAEVAAFVYQALAKAGHLDPIAVKPERRWQITPMITIAARAYFMSLSENGQRLAAIVNAGPIASPEAEVQVWNAQTGSLLLIVPRTSNISPVAVAISRDGTKVAFITTTDSPGILQQMLTVQTVEDGRVLLTKSLYPPEDQISKTSYSAELNVLDVVFSPDGKQVMTQVGLRSQNPLEGNLYNRLNFHDIATGEVTQSINLINLIGTEGTGIIKSTFSPDGRLLAVLDDMRPYTSGPTAINIWQRNNSNRFDYMTKLRIAKEESAASNIAFTNSNLLNIVAYGPDQTRFNTWNLQTAEQVTSTLLPAEECIDLVHVVPSPDGTGYYSSYSDSGTCLGNIQTGEFQRSLTAPFSDLFAVFSGDGNYVAAANEQNIHIFSKAKP